MQFICCQTDGAARCVGWSRQPWLWQPRLSLADRERLFVLLFFHIFRIVEIKTAVNCQRDFGGEARAVFNESYSEFHGLRQCLSRALEKLRPILDLIPGLAKLVGVVNKANRVFLVCNEELHVSKQRQAREPTGRVAVIVKVVAQFGQQGSNLGHLARESGASGSRWDPLDHGPVGLEVFLRLVTMPVEIGIARILQHRFDDEGVWPTARMAFKQLAPLGFIDPTVRARNLEPD
jgi:hypothetical protein